MRKTIIERQGITVNSLCLAAIMSLVMHPTMRADDLDTAGKVAFPQPDTRLTVAIKVGSDDWPWWRGPKSDNHARVKQPPIYWNDTQGVHWKVAIPGRGHACPCIVGDRIFISSADEKKEIQFLVCYDRRSGKRLWRKDLKHGGFMTVNSKNSHASATPACDGQHVFIPLMNGGNMWVVAVNIHGHLVWQRRVGKFEHSNGFSASPVLYENLVIVCSDNDADSILVGLDRSTGRVIWKTQRPAESNSATPVVGHIAGRPQLLLNGSYMMSSYDPLTGQRIWYVKHQTIVAACSAAWSNKHVVASANHPEKDMLCIRANGHGNVTKTHITWRDRKANTYVPSPVVDGQRVYVVIDSGIAYCRNLETGDIVWKNRLAGTVSASPVLAGNYLYVTNEEGTTFVLRASDNFALVATNHIPETTFASLAICSDGLFLRTSHHLYCVRGSASAIGDVNPTE